MVKKKNCKQETKKIAQKKNIMKSDPHFFPQKYLAN